MLSFYLPLIGTIISAILALIGIFFFIKKKNILVTNIVSLVTIILTLIAVPKINIPEPTIYPLDNETLQSSDEIEIRIEANDFFEIYYSLDGSEPREGNKYEEPLIITKSTTVSAKSKFLLWWSELTTRAYKINETSLGTSQETKDKVIEELKSEGVPFHELWIAFFENDIEVRNENGEIEYLFGKQIKNLDSIELNLINNEYQINFSDYTIETRNVNGQERKVAIFANIPSGYYDLESNIDGYESLITRNMKLTADYLQGEFSIGEEYWGRNIYMTKNDSTRLLPYRIDVMDSKGNRVSDLTCSLVYEDKTHTIGNYTISNGRIQLNFMAHKGSIIGIVIHDNNDNYYEIEFNDVDDFPVIIVD